MSLRDLSRLVERLTHDVEALEQVPSTRTDGDFVADDTLNICKQTIRRNILSSNLEYARKLLGQIDKTPVAGGIGGLSEGNELNSSAKATILAERRRIRNIQDVQKLQLFDGTLSQRIDTLNITLETKNFSASKKPQQSVTQTVAELPADDVDMLSTPSATPIATTNKSEAFAIPTGTPTTLESRLDYHRQQQDSISASLLAQTQILKRNAVALGEKLDVDIDVVNNATAALDRNVDNMKRTGGRLTQYRQLSAIGWRFYIVSALVMFVSVIVGLMVIKLLPKWS
ncbi:hypothetical protein LIPSTDRAFT_1755 [Lipomyces starkeyi NRRL Y-11557]|uniref:t-SNARE coiled-coil homology domain-containing protein n=1 Tax=Lipomyces starkeyi NRRL Y-11557 TaxID=675824 RepID=A0A1E3QBH5_LIPST|nr:hypothetical protein LIPSTDRAFT_1755 [Lipomyces starkeyi NRRL Y-11557]